MAGITERCQRQVADDVLILLDEIVLPDQRVLNQGAIMDPEETYDQVWPDRSVSLPF